MTPLQVRIQQAAERYARGPQDPAQMTQLAVAFYLAQTCQQAEDLFGDSSETFLTRATEMARALLHGEQVS